VLVVVAGRRAPPPTPPNPQPPIPNPQYGKNILFKLNLINIINLINNLKIIK
jgi:hypothetical protein